VRIVNGGPQDARMVHLLALVVVLSNAAGNTLLRVGLSSERPIVSPTPASYLSALDDGWVILGVLILTGWMIAQLSLLSWADLSYVLPVTSAAYVLIAILGAFALHERVSPAHWIGIALIVCGVVIVGRTPPLTAGGAG